MSAHRHDLYRGIHKALRAAMFDTVHRLGAMDPDDAQDLQRTLDQARQLLGLLASHVKHENDFVHTAIEARLPGGACQTAEAHHGHLEDLALLAAELDALQRAAPAARGALAQRAYLQFGRFVGEQLAHMQVEETQNNAALWSLYDDAELQALHGRLLASVAPRDSQLALAWMARALNPAEVAELFGGMRRQAPPEAFGAALALARGQLDAGRWQRLAGTLGLPA
ncbi:MAG: hypothetical protein U1F53_12515 [Burkholderiaceae bacterium]